jgi:methyltransferase (TIGR00027 family)
MVGSGYDSRVYRFAAQLAGVRAFEIDRAATLTEKRRRVSKRGYPDAAVTHVALDLNLDTPLQALRQHGYADRARTLFVCSGVLMYLEPEAVARLLGFVAEAGKGSSICFDYVFASAMADPDSHYGARRMLRNVNRAGEPYRFAIDPGDMPALLGRWGLTVTSSAGPDELQDIYLSGAEGARRRPICRYVGLVHGKLRASEGDVGQAPVQPARQPPHLLAEQPHPGRE